MKKFSNICIVLIMAILFTLLFTACNKGVEDDEGDTNETQEEKGDSNTMLFNPIEVTDSINWSENADYTVTPVEYSNATITKFAELYNNNVRNDLLNNSDLQFSSSYSLTNAEKERYDSLFEAGENSDYSSFGYYSTYYEKEDEERKICIMRFEFVTTNNNYRRTKTQEDMTAAQNFYDSLAENPVTANGEELTLKFKYENFVFVGNENGFNYLHQDYVEAALRLAADEEWAEDVNSFIGIVSNAGVAEAKLNAVLDTIKTVNQANNVIKTRAEAFNATNEEDDIFIENTRSILDSIIMNISIDQMALFGFNYILLDYQSNIDYWNREIEELDPASSNYQNQLKNYERRRNESINTKTTIENIPQSQFLVFSRILISMLKTSFQLQSMDDTKELYSLLNRGDFQITDMAAILGREIDSLNIGQGTMSLLVSTLADMRIMDTFFTGELNNVTMNEATEDEDQQEYNNYLKAYDNGTHDALHEIKDDFSAILSIISKVCNSINDTDMTSYSQKSIYTILDGSVSFSVSDGKYYIDSEEVTEEQYNQAREEATIYYVDREETTQEVYNQAFIENDKYTIRILVSALSDLTNADYEMLFSNFNAAATAMNDAFVEQGFEADEDEGTLPTQQELITALKNIAAMTDEDIQDIESSEDSEDVYIVLRNLNIYFHSMIANIYSPQKPVPVQMGAGQ